MVEQVRRCRRRRRRRKLRDGQKLHFWEKYSDKVFVVIEGKREMNVCLKMCFEWRQNIKKYVAESSIRK